MQTIADQMLTQGVTVLAIVNLDSDSGAAIQAKAKKAGVATIDYDRLTLGGSADYYVSFDNAKVGTLQGEGLREVPGDKPANIVYLNGSPTDNNATLFAAARTRSSTRRPSYKKVAEQAVPDWDNVKAGTIFEQMFTQQKGKIDGVLAANDGLGNAAIADPEEEQSGRQGPGDRSGRDGPGSAERPRRQPVHDGLQVREGRGRRSGRPGHRDHQGPEGHHHRHRPRRHGQPRRPVGAAGPEVDHR